MKLRVRRHDRPRARAGRPRGSPRRSSTRRAAWATPPRGSRRGCRRSPTTSACCSAATRRRRTWPTVLNEVGWKGNLEDFDRAAASAEITEVQIAPGTRLPFMSSRKNRKAHALVDVALGRQEADRRLRVRDDLELRALPRRDAQGLRQLLGRGARQGRRPIPSATRRKIVPPVVSLSAPAEACVTQPVDIAVNVQNPPADGKVTVAVNGKELMAGSLTGGAFKATFPGAQQPGTYEVTAISGGVTGRTSRHGQALHPDLRHHAHPEPGEGRQADHRRRLRLARRGRRPRRRQVGQARGGRPEGRRSRARTTSPPRTS